jgi:hypothetical protein
MAKRLLRRVDDEDAFSSQLSTLFERCVDIVPLILAPLRVDCVLALGSCGRSLKRVIDDYAAVRGGALSLIWRECCFKCSSREHTEEGGCPFPLRPRPYPTIVSVAARRAFLPEILPSSHRCTAKFGAAHFGTRCWADSLAQHQFLEGERIFEIIQNEWIERMNNPMERNEHHHHHRIRHRRPRRHRTK